MENQTNPMESSPSVPAPDAASANPSLLGVLDLWSNAWAIFKERFKTIVLVLLPLFIVQAILFLSLVFVLGAENLIFPTDTAASLFIWIVGLWVTISLLYVIVSGEKKMSAGEALRKGARKVVPYLWVAILGGMITVGGIFLFLVPGIIFAVWFSLAFYILIVEDQRGMNALFRSKQLVIGYWWSVFGRLLFVGIISYLAIVIVGILAGVLVGVSFVQFAGDGLQSESFFTGSLVVFGGMRLFLEFFQLLVGALGLVFGMLLYKDLKRVKGNPAFEEPSSKTKLKYIAVGLAGLMLIPIMGIVYALVLAGLFHINFSAF
jgi:hypothetical protein